MHFQIYVPRPDMSVVPSLAAAGLAELQAGAEHVEAAGPDGGRGYVYAWRKPTDACRDHGYFPDRQTWIPSKPAGRYYVGLWNDAPPTPAELARPRPLEGSPVGLGDGREWLIPAAARVPRDCVLDDDGVPAFVVGERCRAFWDESERFFRDLVLADVEARKLVIDADWWAYLCRALAMNYRVVPELVSHLRLFDTDTMFAAVMATVDGLRIREAEAQKKTADGTPA